MGLLVATACTAGTHHGRLSPSTSPSGAAANVLDHLLAQERDDVLRVSRQFIIALTTYDAGSLLEEERTVLAMTTDGFHEQYKRLIGNNAFAKAVAQANVISRGSVAHVSCAAIRHLTEQVFREARC